MSNYEPAGLAKFPGIAEFVPDLAVSHAVQCPYRFDQHCYGCTAGSGSSCGGAGV